MSPKSMRLTVAAVAAIAAAVIVYLLTRGHDDAPAATAPKPADAPAASHAPAPGAPPADAEPARVRRLPDDAARMRVMAAIAAARARRTATAPPTPSPSTSTSSTSPGHTPSLDEPPPMSKEGIRTSFRAVVPLLTECYEQALPHLQVKDGEIKVHMRATGEPDVGTLIETADLEADGGFLDDKDLGECLHETLMSVELPPMPEGGVVEITYPLAFQQAPD